MATNPVLRYWQERLAKSREVEDRLWTKFAHIDTRYADSIAFHARMLESREAKTAKLVANVAAATEGCDVPHPHV